MTSELWKSTRISPIETGGIYIKPYPTYSVRGQEVCGILKFGRFVGVHGPTSINVTYSLVLTQIATGECADCAWMSMCSRPSSAFL